VKAGDPIWYLQSVRGGYGWDDQVPGEYLRATPRRVLVQLFTRAGEVVRVFVAAENLTPREERTP